MPTREERSAEAAKHVSLMKTFFGTETQKAVESATIYEDGEGLDLAAPDARFEQTATEVTTKSAVVALYNAKGSVAVLDNASFTRPAGGYLDGSFGPEQILCAESNLFNVLQGLNEAYYAKNKHSQRGMLFTSRAMYLKDIRFNRRGEIRNADVIVIAAPNRKRALENHRDIAECDNDLARRIETIMNIAANGGCDTLVLNSFGCGAYGNDPSQVAGLFASWLEKHPGVFETVVFSAPSGPSFDAFNARFGKIEEAPKEIPVQDDEEEEEEGFTLDFELPEGVTLR